MLMTQEDVKKLIARSGKFIRMEGRKQNRMVKCQACGKEIYNTDTDELDAAVGLRGDVNIWHRSCGVKAAWNSRIK